MASFSEGTERGPLPGGGRSELGLSCMVGRTLGAAGRGRKR